MYICVYIYIYIYIHIHVYICNICNTYSTPNSDHKIFVRWILSKGWVARAPLCSIGNAADLHYVR